MKTWFGQRLVSALFSLLAAWLLVFSLLRLVPGDPVDMMLGEQARGAEKAALRSALGLDLDLAGQWRRDFTRLLQGNLGDSLVFRRPVSTLVRERAGPTAALALAALAVAWLLALPLGMLAGWRPGSAFDRTGRLLAILGISVPNFWLGPLLLLLFSVTLGWLPLGGYGSWPALLLPALTLGTALAALLTRMLRAGIADQRQSAFLVAARARGCSETRLLLRHALRPALIPVLTVAGLQLGSLLTGAVITETVFQWPGLGRLLVQAVQGRDYPLVQGLVLVFTGAYIAVNLLVDLAYAALDPRIRTAGSGDAA